MTTPFLGLTNAIKAALLEAPAVLPAARIKRGRRVPVQITDASAVYLNLTRSDGEHLDIEAADTEWKSTVTVAVYARATGTADAEEAIDPLLAAVYGRLKAMAPPAGAQSCALDPQIAWDIDEADQTCVGAVLAMRITHITTGAALAAA